MARHELKDTLSALDEALTRDLDADDLAALEAVRDKIERVLDATEERARAPQVAVEVGGEVERFAVRHPQLSSLLERAAELLSGLGI
jgi:hypothetical protein